MFLKSMELTGFKSFADKTTIRFDEGITGIVGPNGCGKSNVNDAIRWVLGEQSSRSLRSGSSMADIIFAGSESRRPVNLARVSLVFDNTRRIFKSNFDEIEITREIRRNGDTACFLNKTPCRLKDINELVMDTGLGRDSLSIISQGNISSFADARPEERRLLFEEAAGVAKYKKRKKDSLGRLENMQENLNRVQDLIDELSKQIEELSEQAEKANEYNAMAQELASIEISVLAIQIGQYQDRLKEINEALQEQSGQLALDSASLEEKENAQSALRQEVFALSQKISQLQNTYTQTMEESYAIQRRKDQLDEKRKYALEAEDASIRAAFMKEMLDEAKYEYEDRKGRLKDLQNQLHEQNQNVNACKNRLTDLQHQKEQKQNQIHSFSNKAAQIESRLSAPVSYNQGVNAIIKAGKAIQGMEGTVRSLMLCDPDYEAALASALGGASDQIVTRDEAAARFAIGWLKKNRAGRATFLPLTVCRPHYLAPNQLETARNTPGILGVMEEFVRCDNRYEKVKGRLLGNILLAMDLESANEAGNRLKHSVKIVTLDGDVVHSGGAMTGGSMKNNSTAALRKDLASVQGSMQAARLDLAQIETRIQNAQSDLDAASERQVQIRIDYEKLDNVYKVKKDKYESLLEEYKQLSSLVSAGQEAAREGEGLGQDSLVVQLSDIHKRLDEVTSQIQTARKEHLDKSEAAESMEKEVRTLRRSIASFQRDIHDLELEKARLETKSDEALQRLNTEYSMTYEAALLQKQDVDLKSAASRVRTLKAAIHKLGDVNLKAPAMLEETKGKQERLISQKEELESASDKLKNVIGELDEKMISQFSEMFEKINDQLDGVFKAMFGGGRASLKLTDPDDILNTGVDIDVQPPGKMVKNIQTFSGGEKALIAISVLFAILKARTMPLCIFDEVEAALDQANVERFARYLQHFKDQSQFIVVTHRPGTMEECDALYGVTMQKDGVSQVLKVLLKDAAEYAKETN